MRIVSFNHSLTSCWNHGNAHFLRGVLRELQARGHAIRSFEPRDGWSRMNLERAEPFATNAGFRRDFPDLADAAGFIHDDLDAMLDGADLVLVHEWTDPALLARIGSHRSATGRYCLLFHDTHHRLVSDPASIQALDLAGYDGVLAFGETLAEQYRLLGWNGRVFTWHEAADTRLFLPPAEDTAREGAIWIGNWGDGERDAELRQFLLEPVREAGVRLTVHGVRYPDQALHDLREVDASYRGWLANAAAPAAFARHLFTVHVPRRIYANALRGIPTIRVFEALACGIPLLSAPWEDSENLFRPGDFLLARSGEDMRAHMRSIVADPELRREVAAAGLQTIRSRHTCAHRVDELLAIHARLADTLVEEPA